MFTKILQQKRGARETGKTKSAMGPSDNKNLGQGNVKRNGQVIRKKVNGIIQSDGYTSNDVKQTNKPKDEALEFIEELVFENGAVYKGMQRVQNN